MKKLTTVLLAGLFVFCCLTLMSVSKCDTGDYYSESLGVNEDENAELPDFINNDRLGGSNARYADSGASKSSTAAKSDASASSADSSSQGGQQVAAADQGGASDSASQAASSSSASGTDGSSSSTSSTADTSAGSGTSSGASSGSGTSGSGTGDSSASTVASSSGTASGSSTSSASGSSSTPASSSTSDASSKAAAGDATDVSPGPATPDTQPMPSPSPSFPVSIDDAASQATDAAASASGQMSAEMAALVKAVGGKEWKLAEVRKSASTITVNRDKLTADGFGDLFTIAFADRISGKAAPNRYNAPYSVGANGSLTIQQPASTLMAPIYDPERIREKEYFQLLVNAKTWKLNGGKLEIGTADADGKAATLVYGN